MKGAEQLVVVLGIPLRLLLGTGLGGDVKFGGRDYRDLGLGDWSGFYDWLRTADGKVIGVRTTLAGPEYAEIRDAVESHPDVVRNLDELCIFFGPIRVFDAASSDDQDLGDHRILRASDATFAFAFDPSGIASDQMSSLRKRCALIDNE